MSEVWDFVIIGAGAAGLTAAQYGARANLKTLLIEEMAPGGQALLIDQLENYPGFPEPINGFDFSQRMHQQAERFGAGLKTATVNGVEKKGNIFHIATNEGEVQAKAVLISTGAQHRKMGVPGEEEFSGRGVSYCATCDGPFFKNKRILVVGGGDAACDESIFLAGLTKEVILVLRRDKFRAQAAVAERVLKHPHIEVRFNTVVDEILGDKKVTGVRLSRTDKNETYELPVDAVFVFIGSIPRTELFPELEKDETGYIVTDSRMMTAIPGLYAAGDVRASEFRQLIVAAAEGAIGAHAASQYIDLLDA